LRDRDVCYKESDSSNILLEKISDVSVETTYLHYHFTKFVDNLRPVVGPHHSGRDAVVVYSTANLIDKSAAYRRVAEFAEFELRDFMPWVAEQPTDYRSTEPAKSRFRDAFRRLAAEGDGVSDALVTTLTNRLDIFTDFQIAIAVGNGFAIVGNGDFFE
jgi:hypothetical protein